VPLKHVNNCSLSLSLFLSLYLFIYLVLNLDRVVIAFLRSIGGEPEGTLEDEIEYGDCGVFTEADIKSLRPKVKQMGLTYSAEAYGLYLKYMTLRLLSLF